MTIRVIDYLSKGEFPRTTKFFQTMFDKYNVIPQKGDLLRADYQETIAIYLSDVNPLDKVGLAFLEVLDRIYYPDSIELVVKPVQMPNYNSK